MAISNFPASLQPLMDSNYNVLEFGRGLSSTLGYRSAATPMSFKTGIGEKITRVKAGLLPVDLNPLNPTVADSFPSNSYTNLDNGLVPVMWPTESYTVELKEWARTMNLNTVTETLTLGSLFAQNAYALGVNAAQTRDQLARNAIYGAYMSGNTRVRLASSSTSVAVDDIRGFTSASPGNPLAIVIGAGQYSVVSAIADVTNLSTVMGSGGGVSGVLTLANPVTTADGAINNGVYSGIAPSIVRPSARASTNLLTGSDTLSMSTILDAKAKLENNAVPKINGFYNLFLDPTSSRELFADNDFKQLYQGATSENAAFRMGVLDAPFLGIRFVQTTEAILQPHPTLAGSIVHRPIMVGEGALLEGNFAGQDHHDTGTSLAEFAKVDGVTMVTREPLDRLQQNITQSWYWIGGYAVPTDTTANSSIIATASNAAYKRAVVIEHI